MGRVKDSSGGGASKTAVKVLEVDLTFTYREHRGGVKGILVYFKKGDQEHTNGSELRNMSDSQLRRRV